MSRPYSLLSTLVALLISGSALAADASFAGSYRGDTIAVEITAAGAGYGGTIRLASQRFPLTATANGNQLHGKFTSGADSFDFTATLDGRSLTLRSGASQYVLQRVADAAPAATQPQEDFVRLSKTSILDPLSNNMTAFTMLMPSDWKVEGSVVWRWNAYSPTTVHARLYNPNGVEQLAFYPSLLFMDGVRESAWNAAIIAGPQAAQHAIAAFPEGGNYTGFEIRKRLTDPVEVLRLYGLPRLRPELANLRPVSVTDMPEITKAAAVPYANVAGAQVKVVRVRYAYDLKGTAVEEDFYCTLASAPTMPPLVAWGMEIQSFRARKGELDEKMRLFQCMNHSATMDLKWYAGVQSVQQMMQDANIKAIEDAGRLSRYIAKRNDEISQIIREGYENRQRVQDKVQDAWSQVIRGVERYKDPYSSNPVELPSGYDHAFISPRGEIIMSNNPNFNPGVKFHEDWRELPKTRQ